MRSDDIPLHDIKPLVDIQDYTPYYLAAAAVVAAVLMGLVLFLLVRRWRNARRSSRRHACLESLKRIAFDDAKAAAYTITRLGRCFKDDSPRLYEAYENLCRRLEPYKYKKDVPKVDEETRAYFRIFLGMIDV
ncbi:MAG TPA: hypothetical protein ENL04_03110 [Sulfuricurvum sp.]|nr:hypothetical protein [Sulfuricurvum sp.]